jgi:ABC-type phosphate transport system substrate-binding protein
MKRKANFLVLLVIATLFQVVSVNAQENFSIRSAKFVTPLIRKWIEEYSKVHPQMCSIRIVDNGKENEADVHISIFSETENSGAYTIGRYAILPIAGKNNRLITGWKNKKLNGKRLKELYFEKDILDEDYEPEKESKYNATVYAGNRQQSVTAAFAGYFGYDTKALKGKKIAGDDIFLNNAIQKDNSGVSFNNLNYIFDLQSRRLKDELVLLPLDLKKEYIEILAESNLDKTIELLESKKIDLIPVEELTLEVADADNPEIQQFLQWVLSEGQAYNHEFGFLNAKNKDLAQHSKK